MFEMIISGYRWIFLQMSSVLGPGWSIVALSFICSALMAPLMKAVGGIVKRETDYQSVINPQLEAIKTKYTSDMERHLHIQRLYSRYSYSPLSAVKKVMPLFVQIPFLLLTYYMLKGTAELNGVSFLFLKDLGQADALIPVLHANLLPLVMTGVNILTVFATPSFTQKDWTQAIGIALLFLFLLYTAPSALLLYWTLNNIITMVRTLVGGNHSGCHHLAMQVKRIRSLRGYLTDNVIGLFVLILVLMGAFLHVTGRFLPFGSPGLTMQVSYYGMVICPWVAAILTFYKFWRNEALDKLILLVVMALPILYVVGIIYCFLFARTWYRDCLWLPSFYTVSLAVMGGCLVPHLILSLRRPRGIAGDLLTGVRSSWFLFVVPIVLAVHYSFSSPGFMLPPLSVVNLCFFMLVPTLLTAVIFIVLFRSETNVRIIVDLTMAFCIGFYLVPMISTDSGIWAYRQNVFIRLAMPLAMSVALLLIRSRKMIALFVGLLSASLLVNSIFNKSADQMAMKDVDRSETARILQDLHCVKTNNVYFLIYDGYPHRVIREGLGLDDKFCVDAYLEEKGFHVYDAYSTGSHTIESMSEAFTIGGIRGESPRATMSGDSLFNDFLSAAGYRTCYVTGAYMMPSRGERMPASDYFPKAGDMVRPDLVLWGCIVKGLLAQVPQVFNDFDAEDWFAAEHRLFDEFGPGCNFIYSHTGFPGHCVASPKYRKSDADEIAKYKVRQEEADVVIQRDVELLLAKDEDSIIIIASDHGADLITPEKPGQVDARHLLDRHGIILAIRWPKDYIQTIDIKCLQDVLPEVMAYLSQNSSVRTMRSDSETLPVIWPILSDKGWIKDGVIQHGANKGGGLSAAAATLFRK